MLFSLLHKSIKGEPMRLLARIVFSLVLILSVGLVLGGGWLIALGGSWYYLGIGVLYVVACILALKQQPLSALLFVLAMLITAIWATWEVGFNFWALFPRILAPLAITALAMLLIPRLANMAKAKSYYLAGIGFAVAFIVMFALAFIPHGKIHNKLATYTQADSKKQPSNWSAYAKNTMGMRYADFNLINRQNVHQLKPAWTYHTGYQGKGVDQNTPLMIDGIVYSCTPDNKISALDADTGQEIWTFSSQAKSPVWQRCRSLGYYESSEPASTPEGKPSPCKQRIVQTTIDARLLEVDAKTGELCQSFGEGGVVPLAQHMGEIKPGFYFQTSAPLVARDYIVVGGWVMDNYSRGEPSGVIRAFDARNGQLVWAWDLGNPGITKEPPAGQTYTRGTPNMWTHAAYDDRLGLIYAPLGNGTPDYYGQGRPQGSEDYNSTLVALDVMTGRERWRFQTVHHDIWDYDLPAQPALVDLSDGTPAVVQATKRGQLFFLNRETGKPITEVVEKPVPQTGAVPEETLAPTQPYSVGMPTIGAETLTEAKTWGATMYDQLLCRIAFKQLHYEGDFTPIGLKPTLQQPSNLGGMNWGSLSVDPVNQLIFMNDMRVPTEFYLVPRQDYETVAKRYPATGDGHGSSPQLQTPYGMITTLWMSKLGIPCNQPPYGTVTAVDLKTKSIVWQVPVGTVEETGPLGIKSHLKMPVGMPAYAGTMTTAGGLVFYAGSQDYFLRAYDAETGEEIWKYPLPVGSSATPMTYISPKTGKQYVVISVGGAGHSKDVGDYVMAFALGN